MATRRAWGSGLQEGVQLARGVCRLSGSQGGGSGCCEQVTGRRMRLQCDISGFKKAWGHLWTRSVGKWEWVWVWAHARGQSGTLNLGSAPRSRGGGGAAASRTRGWRSVDSSRESWVFGSDGRAHRCRSPLEVGRLPLTSFHPAAARPDHGRPEAPGCAACVCLWRAPYSLSHLACRHPAL